MIGVIKTFLFTAVVAELSMNTVNAFSLDKKKSNEIGSNIANSNMDRRKVFQSIIASSSIVLTSSSPVLAKDELFKPNPLTNSVLEQIRIWEQAEKDEMKYGGELAPGTPPVREAYAKLLVPILQMAQDFDSLENLFIAGSLSEAKGSILDKACYDKIAFKKIFNAFADNIYYTDPDRANVYLGGGATPKNEQSIAYLYRNDILTNVEALQAEVAYLIKPESKDEDTKDLFMYLVNAKNSMAKYLELVPPAELRAATKYLVSQQSNINEK